MNVDLSPHMIDTIKELFDKQLNGARRHGLTSNMLRHDDPGEWTEHTLFWIDAMQGYRAQRDNFVRAVCVALVNVNIADQVIRNHELGCQALCIEDRVMDDKERQAEEKRVIMVQHAGGNQEVDPALQRSDK